MVHRMSKYVCVGSGFHMPSESILVLDNATFHKRADRSAPKLNGDTMAWTELSRRRFDRESGRYASDLSDEKHKGTPRIRGQKIP